MSILPALGLILPGSIVVAGSVAASPPVAGGTKPAPPKAGRAPKAPKPPVTAKTINKVVGMQAFLNRLDKLSLRLNDLGLTPAQVIDMVNADADGAIRELNKRVDIQEVRVQQANRGNATGSSNHVDTPHSQTGEEKKWTREETVGPTPGKESQTGKAVQARMRKDGLLRGQPPNVEIFHKPTKRWYPIAETDMGHTKDAVTWWKNEGMFHGEKSKTAQAWMNDPGNYELQPSGHNRSEGAKLTDRYVAPHPDPITEEELKHEKVKDRSEKPGAADIEKPASKGQATQLRNEVAAFEGEAAKLSAEAKAIETRAAELDKRAAKARSSFGQEKIDADAFLAERTGIDAERAKLATREQALSKQAATLQKQGEEIVTRFAKSAPAEVRAAFGTEAPKDVLKRARASGGRVPSAQRGSATLGAMVGVIGLLATAYFLAESIRYVMDAKTTMGKVKRAAELGGTVAAGIGVEALLSVLARSNAVGFVLAGVLTMPSDQGGASEREEQRLRKEAEEKERRKRSREEFLAIGKFLETNAPGSVEWVEDTYYIKDQALWDKTVADFHELAAEHRAVNEAKLQKRAFDLGMVDGRMGSSFLNKDSMEGWKEVKEAPSPDVKFLELFQHYKRGFAKGNALQAKTDEAVRRMGYKDGKEGTRRTREAIVPKEVITAMTQAGIINLPVVLAELYASYDDAWKSGSERRSKGQ